MVGVAYIVITFFLIPFTLIYSTTDFSANKMEEEQLIELKVEPVSAAIEKI
jgi:hypothetical protein